MGGWVEMSTYELTEDPRGACSPAWKERMPRLFVAHGRGVVAIVNQELTETMVLTGNRVLLEVVSRESRIAPGLSKRKYKPG